MKNIPENEGWLCREKFNGIKGILKDLIRMNWATDKLVACVYDLYQEYIISEDQESELYDLVDPEEKFNDCHNYWHEMDYDNPLLEYLR